MFHVPRISGYLFNCGKNKCTSKTRRTKLLSIQHLGPKGTHRPSCPCLPLGFPHLPTAQDPMSAPPRPSAPAPVTPQQGQSPAPHSGPMSWPVLGPSPGRCLMPGLPRCPQCPAPGGAVGQAPAARPCPDSPMGSPCCHRPSEDPDIQLEKMERQERKGRKPNMPK